MLPFERVKHRLLSARGRNSARNGALVLVVEPGLFFFEK